MTVDSLSDPICISAYGAVTPIGNSLEEIKDNLINNRSGIKLIDKFDTNLMKNNFAGVPDVGEHNIKWPLDKPLKNGEVLYTRLAIERLLANGQLHEYYQSDDIGCILGLDRPSFNVDSYINYCKAVTKKGSERNFDTKIASMVESLKLNEFENVETTSILKEVNDHIKIGSTCLCHLGLCAASAYSLIMAARDIYSGKSKAVITGGVSARVSPYNVSRLESMGVTAGPNFPPEQVCRPFDKQRSGFVLAEGAILFSVERLSAVRERGVEPLAIISGYGASMGSEHIVAPHSEEVEMLLCMNKAIKNSGVPLEDIDLINAHATSTQQNDYHESKAIKEIFGDLQPIISATKSQHGHLIAAAAAMEMLCVIISMRYDFVPKIINLDEIDFNFPSGLNFAAENVHKKIKYALKNSFGMGSLAASVIMKNPRI
ncbi:3-oxoacyl-[acyl-carrier-protein] synthase 2 [Vibrio mangrovi]|nr:3-oxoacyl-[acyl-carrier-protein] synthase 2 [Vibrio mangrovi]